MRIAYKKLWHMLIDRNMTKSDLQQAARLSWVAIARMGCDETITIVVQVRICVTRKCDIRNIMEIAEKDI